MESWVETSRASASKGPMGPGCTIVFGGERVGGQANSVREGAVKGQLDADRNRGVGLRQPGARRLTKNRTLADDGMVLWEGVT